MAQKKAYTDDELLAELEGLGTSDNKKPPTFSSKPSAAPSAGLEDDPLAELENLAKAKPPSRPATPRTTVRANPTPGATASTRTSEEASRSKNTAAPRKSTESARSFHQGFTPTSEESAEEREHQNRAAAAAAPAPAPAPAASSGGGWWGSVFATATAAVTQAQAAVKEIQSSEETQKWMDQVRGNVNLEGLNKLRSDIQSRALPTFTNIINTIAPPISQHERLQIHIIHDLVNYPSLDPTVYNAFSRVMSQVEGGDLMVVQRGSEASQKRSRSSSNTTAIPGWHDGPWWRDALRKRDMNMATGLVEGSKLCRANAEAYSSDFFTAKGGLEQAKSESSQPVSEAAPVRSSDIFLAIQAIGYDAEAALFSGSTKTAADTTTPESTDADADSLVVFAIFLLDPIHEISFSALTQPMPRRWIDWLDASSEHAAPEGPNTAGQVPEEIAHIVASGGVDPREWVSEWVEESLGLGVGIVAQRYVARRMGVGEGGSGIKGKSRAAEIDAGAGEAARAGIVI